MVKVTFNTAYRRIEQMQNLGFLSCADLGECKYLQPLHIFQKLFANLQVSFDTLNCRPKIRENEQNPKPKLVPRQNSTFFSFTSVKQASSEEGKKCATNF